MRKTKEENWKAMRKGDDRYLRCQGRDSHLVPIEFLYRDPLMLRPYGGRVLMFNMNKASAQAALASARETDNGYILVSKHISLEHLEAVYDLDKNTWDVAYTPITDWRLNDSEGITDARHLLRYYARLFHLGTHAFADLEPLLKEAARQIGKKLRRRQNKEVNLFLRT